MALTEKEKEFLDEELKTKIKNHLAVVDRQKTPVIYQFDSTVNLSEPKIYCDTCKFQEKRETTMMGSTYHANVCRLLQPFNQTEKIFNNRVIKLFIGDGEKELLSVTAIDSKTNTPFWCPIKKKFELS